MSCFVSVDAGVEGQIEVGGSQEVRYVYLFEFYMKGTMSQVTSDD